MIKMLNNIFKANPDKSTIVLKGKCSDCGCDVVINITSTSGGFGLMGGALYESSPNGYFIKCPNCHQVNTGIADPYTPKCAHPH